MAIVVQFPKPNRPIPGKRWFVQVSYRHEDGNKFSTFELEELYELHEIIEAGPHWDTVDEIVINRLNGDKTLTVEQAEKL